MTQPDPNATTGQAAKPAAVVPTGAATPPWGDPANFDPDKAWKLIENLRSDNEQLKQRPVMTDEQRTQLAEFDAWKKQNQTDLEKAQGEVTRWQTDAETWRKAAVGSKIQALAADTFADPSDAVAALADKNFLDAGGQIDEAVIKRELAATLQAKPHWAKPADQTPRAPQPNAAQGASGAGQNDPAAQFGALLQGAMATGQ